MYPKPLKIFVASSFAWLLVLSMGTVGPEVLNSDSANRSPASDIQMSMPDAITIDRLTPRDPAKVNVASFFQTGQNTTALPALVQTVAQISDSSPQQASSESKAKAPTLPSGIPYWDGIGELPTVHFSTDFTFDTSGCSIIPVTFSSEYLPDATLPTLWCGAVSTATQMAANGLQPIPSSPSSSSSSTEGLAI